MDTRGPCANCGNMTTFARNAVGGRDRVRFCAACWKALEKQSTPRAYLNALIREWVTKNGVSHLSPTPPGAGEEGT